ncbi:ANM_HP_G0056480.mRNA.1.CDS.1 [Saccharomyces cerevisiae]|nr:ANM_HP_G0056480.mRNA.1.CDS.1 [Saccharomyces cerevisiae]CAI7028435.1 ANM_HP_G0056480.mRNA.1.CDS.1 [Saccharomyces cerevisiae]
MDKLISFQMGRFYQLSLPAGEMLRTESDTVFKRDAQDLNLTRDNCSQLGQWYDTFIWLKSSQCVRRQLSLLLSSSTIHDIPGYKADFQ